jgi:hypothetical protein
MGAKGGTGILNPPSDGDDIAPVIPLRQRQGQGPQTAPPAARQSLPRERSAFDPEIEPLDVPLRRRRRWPAMAHQSTRGLPHRPAIDIRRRAVVRAAVATGAAVLLIAFVVQALDSQAQRRPTPAATAHSSLPGLRSSQLPAKSRVAASAQTSKLRRAHTRHHRSTSSSRSRSHQLAASAGSVPDSSSVSQSAPPVSSASRHTEGQAAGSATSPSQTATSSGSSSEKPAAGTQAVGQSGALGPGSSPNG